MSNPWLAGAAAAAFSACGAEPACRRAEDLLPQLHRGGAGPGPRGAELRLQVSTCAPGNSAAGLERGWGELEIEVQGDFPRAGCSPAVSGLPSPELPGLGEEGGGRLVSVLGPRKSRWKGFFQGCCTLDARDLFSRLLTP